MDTNENKNENMQPSAQESAASENKEPVQATTEKKTAPLPGDPAASRKPGAKSAADLSPEERARRMAIRKRRQAEQAKNAEAARSTEQEKSVNQTGTGTVEEVYHPRQDGKRRPASENPPVRQKQKKPAPKKAKKKPEESQYQPYRAANQRKKAQQAGKVKKFFSAENPVLAYFNRGSGRDAFAEDSELAQKRKAQRAADAAKKKKKQSPFSAPTVVYTQPQAFNRDRLLVQLLTIVAVVLAFVLGLSVFFKVKVITISGAEVYSPWAIQEASGIKEGDNLLTFGRAKASGKITANLPYVKSVRIGIKLPDTVNIEIEEEDVVYAIKSEEGIWWLMNSSGKVVEMSNNSQAKNYTQVVGVTLTNPQKNETGVPTEEVPKETTENGEFVPVLVTGEQRLSAALQILKALEANDIVGGAASVDVSHLEDIILWYGTRYQVNLGDTSQLENKIAFMYDAILQMSDYQTGILDVSFTIWPDQIGYTPFQ